MITAAGHATGVQVRAIRREDLLARELIVRNITAGSIDEFEGKHPIVLGGRLAARLGVTVGSTVDLVSPQTNTTVLGSVPRTKTYDVIALFEVGMYEFDGTIAFMPLEAGQLFFQAKDKATDIEVLLQHPDDSLQTSRRIRSAIEGGYYVWTWQDRYRSFFSALAVERFVMGLILSLLIVIAAVSILVGFVMLVKDKGREIAILRTMGATRGAIMRIFVLSGLVIGAIGAGLGVVLAIAFCANIEGIRQWLQDSLGIVLFPADVYFLKELPAKIDPLVVAGFSGFALLWSFLATLYPAWRAARLDPVEALRYE
jgi:lipoprotein-releasing system permease protein